MRERGEERLTFPLLFHLCFQPITHFCCQLQLFLAIFLLLLSIFLTASYQSLHSHLFLSLICYRLLSILCLPLLCVHPSLPLSVNLSILLQEKVGWPSLYTCIRGREKERKQKLARSYSTTLFLKVEE